MDFRYIEYERDRAIKKRDELMESLKMALVSNLRLRMRDRSDLAEELTLYINEGKAEYDRKKKKFDRLILTNKGDQPCK